MAYDYLSLQADGGSLYFHLYNNDGEAIFTSISGFDSNSLITFAPLAHTKTATSLAANNTIVAVGFNTSTYNISTTTQTFSYIESEFTSL